MATALSYIAFVWMMEFCFMLYGNNVLQEATRQAVDYAGVHGTIAEKNTGSGSGPGTSDAAGANVAQAAAAAIAQSALHSTVNVSVCPAWWPAGTAVGGFPSSSCSGGTGASPLGHSTYAAATANAVPGSTVTVQVVYAYKPYLPIPFANQNLTFTAAGVVAY